VPQTKTKSATITKTQTNTLLCPTITPITEISMYSIVATYFVGVPNVPPLPNNSMVMGMQHIHLTRPPWLLRLIHANTTSFASFVTVKLLGSLILWMLNITGVRSIQILLSQEERNSTQLYQCGSDDDILNTSSISFYFVFYFVWWVATVLPFAQWMGGHRYTTNA